jgi:hypothetical protein
VQSELKIDDSIQELQDSTIVSPAHADSIVHPQEADLYRLRARVYDLKQCTPWCEGIVHDVSWRYSVTSSAGDYEPKSLYIGVRTS